MLSTDLTLDASTAISAGSAGSTTYSLIGGATVERTVRSVASLALTAPRELSISHLQRRLKGFRTSSNSAVPAPDVVIDRHTVRLDYTLPATNILDPDSRIRSVVQVTFENPRIGSDSADATGLADELKRIVSMLCSDSAINLQRILNRES